MQRTWFNKHINLDLLAQKIEDFFKDNDFDITINKTCNEYQLLAKHSPNYTINGEVLVMIKGKPEEFSVTLTQKEGKEFKPLPFPITLTTFFGGGFLITQHFKAEESWIELRKDFWQHVNKIVENLSRSAFIDENEATNP
ncbi:MAG: hypothetical protein QXQ61_00755 [Candidatus Bathyarchaeia archaeon]